MSQAAKIKDLIPLTSSLFSHIDYQFWDFTSSELDILLLSKCGMRLPSPLIDIIQGPPEDIFEPRPPMTDSQLAQLGSLILHNFKYKWDKLSDLHSEEYDILKNYIDEYEEVIQDDDSSSVSKQANRADRGFETSQLASSTGSTITQQTENNNESESTRVDNFSSDFTRASSDNTTRTDNLSESKTESEDGESTRTDNLSESVTATDDTTVTRTDNLSESITSTDDTTVTRTDNLSESVTATDDTTVTRTDNLSESVTATDDTTVTRTDNLLDSSEGTESGTQTHQGGNYTEETTRVLSVEGTQNSSSDVYGFNSLAPVGDSVNEGASDSSENETTRKLLSGTKTDGSSSSSTNDTSHTGTQVTVTDGETTSSKSNTGTQATVTDGETISSKSNTGTQATVTDGETTSSKSNTGTQSTVTDGETISSKSNTGTQSSTTDIDRTSSKSNTGTQNIAEVSSLSDSTVNVDNQVNTTTTEGSSTSSNESTQKAASSNDISTGSTSQLAEDSVINRALNRARSYKHKGNIGNFTPQQLILQEINLWRWNFIEEVLNDVKNFITLPIYG